MAENRGKSATGRSRELLEHKGEEEIWKSDPLAVGGPGERHLKISAVLC